MSATTATSTSSYATVATIIEPTPNVELLRAVRDQFLAHPGSLCMRGWGYSEKGRHLCNTVGCIAGMAVILDHLKTHKTLRGFDIHAEARAHGHEVLGLPQYVPLGRDFARLTPLFFVELWPPECHVQWRKATTARQRARIVAKLINRVIREKGIKW